MNARCNQCGGDYCADDLLSVNDGSGEYRCKYCNTGRPIEEKDYLAFMHWINLHQPTDVIGTMCHAGDCPITRWYRSVTGQQAYVSIRMHYLSEEDLNNHAYQHNPYWAMTISEAMDKYAEMEHKPITQEEFVTQVLPIAHHLGLPEWKG